MSTSTWQGEVAENLAFAALVISVFGAIVVLNLGDQQELLCECEPWPPVQYVQEREVE